MRRAAMTLARDRSKTRSGSHLNASGSQPGRTDVKTKAEPDLAFARSRCHPCNGPRLCHHERSMGTRPSRCLVLFALLVGSCGHEKLGQNEGSRVTSPRSQAPDAE